MLSAVSSSSKTSTSSPAPARLHRVGAENKKPTDNQSFITIFNFHSKFLKIFSKKYLYKICVV